MVIAAGATLDPVQLLLTQAGIGGIFIALILMGYFWAKPSVMREFAKSDQKALEDKALIESLLETQKQVIPLLIEVDRQVIPLLHEVRTLLQEFRREWEWRERTGRVQEEASRRPSREYGDRPGSGRSERPGPDDHQEGEKRS